MELQIPLKVCAFISKPQ